MHVFSIFFETTNNIEGVSFQVLYDLFRWFFKYIFIVNKKYIRSKFILNKVVGVFFFM